jgi:hypothetical protein
MAALVLVGKPLLFGDPPADRPPGDGILNPPELVAALEPLLNRLQTEGTVARVTDFRKPGTWQKRQFVASEVQFDIVKLDATKALATVSWLPIAFLGPESESREEATRAPLPTEPSHRSKIRTHALLAHEDEEWVVLDVWWRAEALGIERRHSTLDDPQDPVKDWWWALGGR